MAVYRTTHLCTVLCRIQDVERPHVWGSSLVCDVSGVMRTKCLVPGHPNKSPLVYFQRSYIARRKHTLCRKCQFQKSISFCTFFFLFFFLFILSNNQGRAVTAVVLVVRGVETAGKHQRHLSNLEVVILPVYTPVITESFHNLSKLFTHVQKLLPGSGGVVAASPGLSSQVYGVISSHMT